MLLLRFSSLIIQDVFLRLVANSLSKSYVSEYQASFTSGNDLSFKLTQMLNVNIVELSLMNVSHLITLQWSTAVAVRSAKFGCFDTKERIGNLGLQSNLTVV